MQRKKTYSVKEISNMLGLSKSTIYRKIASGELSAYKEEGE